MFVLKRSYSLKWKLELILIIPADYDNSLHFKKAFYLPKVFLIFSLPWPKSKSIPKNSSITIGSDQLLWLPLHKALVQSVFLPKHNPPLSTLFLRMLIYNQNL